MFKHFENTAAWFRAADATGDCILVRLDTGKIIGTVMRRRDGVGWLGRSYVSLPFLLAALRAGWRTWGCYRGLELSRRGIAIVDWAEDMRAVAQVVEIRAGVA